MRYSILAFLLLLWIYAPFASGQIIYVDADANDANDGSSWADAYNYLQEALFHASYGDEIRVAQGIYKPWPYIAPPPPPGSSQSNEKDDIAIAAIDRTVTFQLISGVAVKGGYAGFGEPDPDARDIEMYETILSGDFNGDDGPDFANNAENAYNVITGSGTDENTILDGFTITGGNANAPPPIGTAGGGMKNSNGHLTVANCTFRRNYAIKGGGIDNTNGQPTFANCNFIGNSAQRGEGWIATPVTLS